MFLLLLFALLCCCWGCSEEELYTLLAAVVPNILDLRVIKDKFTGRWQSGDHESSQCAYAVAAFHFKHAEWAVLSSLHLSCMLWVVA